MLLKISNALESFECASDVKRGDIYGYCGVIEVIGLKGGENESNREWEMLLIYLLGAIPNSNSTKEALGYFKRRQRLPSLNASLIDEASPKPESTSRILTILHGEGLAGQCRLMLQSMRVVAKHPDS